MHSHRQARQLLDRGDLVAADQGPGGTLSGHDVHDRRSLVHGQQTHVDADVGRDLALALGDGLDGDRTVLHVLLLDVDAAFGTGIPARRRHQGDEVGAAAVDRHQFHRLGGGGGRGLLGHGGLGASRSGVGRRFGGGGGRFGAGGVGRRIPPAGDGRHRQHQQESHGCLPSIRHSSSSCLGGGRGRHRTMVYHMSMRFGGPAPSLLRHRERW